MVRFQPISGSEIYPYTPHKYQYLIERTGGSVLTTLVETKEIALSQIEEFEMGYTNLWILRRVGLYLDKQKPIRYPDPEEKYAGDRLGRYYIYGNHGTSVSWVKEGSSSVMGYADRATAERCLDEYKKPGENLIIVRLLEDIYWH